MRRIFFLLAVALSAWAAPSARAEIAPPEAWAKVDDDGGLRIYEKKEGDLLAFRAEGSVPASVRDVASAILDSAHTPDWVDHLEEDRVVKRLSPSQFLEYTHVGTPFVLKDRDFLCLVTVKVDEKDKTVTIESHSVEDPSVPPTKYVRGTVVRNEFRLSVGASPRETHLDGEFHIDPKGTVPKWVVNLFQRAWPRKAFLAIQKRAAERKSALPPVFEPLFAPLAGK
jgi:hypothetical protein